MSIASDYVPHVREQVLEDVKREEKFTEKCKTCKPPRITEISHCIKNNPKALAVVRSARLRMRMFLEALPGN